MAITLVEPVSRGGLNANESELYFKSTGLREDAFIVRAFEGEELVSQPFWFRITLDSREPDIAAADVLGKRATFFIRDRAIHGVVTEFEYLGFTADKHAYRAVLRPQLWTRSLRRDSEIFLGVTAKDVIEAALGGLDFSMNVDGTFPSKEYVAQYNETDLDFLSRIAEHWGIAYYIDQDPNGADKVAFFTDSTAAPPAADVPLPFDPEVTLRGRNAAASFFAEKTALVPGRVLVKDFNYRDPETALLSENERRTDDFDSLHYEYGTHHGDQTEGDYLARVRSEAIECQRRVFAGKSNWQEIEAGYIVELEKHPRAAFNGKYLITSVHHRGSQDSQATSEERAGGPEYENEFVCIPADVAYRPPRATPIPRVPGVMTAKIESGGGEYAHIDEDGRYNARMHFDLGDRGEAEASAPLRMNQPYSGAGYGMHFPNHANTEVVWACVNGDPDRPIIVGSVPNPSNASPVTSENRAQSVIRTQGQNEIVIDDTRGKEFVRIETAGHQRLILADKEGYAGLNTAKGHEVQLNDEGKYVQVKSTYGHHMLLDDDLKRMHLATADGHGMLIDDQNKKIAVGDAARNQTITIDINGAFITLLNQTGDTHLEAPKGTVVLHSKAVDVNAEENVDQHGKKIALVADDEISFKCGAASIVLKKDGTIEIKGMKVSVEGISLKLKGSANAEMSGGALAEVSSNGIMKVTGSIVKIN